MALPGLRRNDVAIHDAWAVDPGAASQLQFQADILITRQRSPLHQPGGDQDLDAVTDRENPFLLPIEFLDDLDEGWIVPEELRRSPADQHDGLVIADLD